LNLVKLLTTLKEDSVNTYLHFGLRNCSSCIENNNEERIKITCCINFVIVTKKAEREEDKERFISHIRGLGLKMMEF